MIWESPLRCMACGREKYVYEVCYTCKQLVHYGCTVKVDRKNRPLGMPRKGVPRRICLDCAEND